MSRSALELRLNTLLERGLIREAGQGRSQGGRRPRLLVFSKDTGFVVSIDLGATSVDVAITNLNAETLVHEEQPADVREGPERVLEDISHLIEKVIREAQIDRSLIKGIGMGVPGPVAFQSGLPTAPPIMPGWHHFDIRRYFTERFDRPVFVDNDVNIMALGERWAGIGQTVENFIFVKIGTGIGCGIICHGDIYRGSDGCAGDIGHIQATTHGPICRCGNVGCLEAIAGGAALGRAADDAARNGSSPYLAQVLQQEGDVTAEAVGRAMQQGDHFAVQLVREAGSTIGGVLASLVNFYNPRLIIIGGGVAGLGDLFLASIREAIYRRSLPLATHHLLIQRSALRHKAGVVGAAAMVLSELFKITPVLDGAVPSTP